MAKSAPIARVARRAPLAPMHAARMPINPKVASSRANASRCHNSGRRAMYSTTVQSGVATASTPATSPTRERTASARRDSSNGSQALAETSARASPEAKPPNGWAKNSLRSFTKALLIMCDPKAGQSLPCDQYQTAFARGPRSRAHHDTREPQPVPVGADSSGYSDVSAVSDVGQAVRNPLVAVDASLLAVCQRGRVLAYGALALAREIHRFELMAWHAPLPRADKRG